MLRRFLAYGLTVESDFDIPEFDRLPIDPSREHTDVRLRLAAEPIEGFRVSEYSEALPPPRVTVHGSSCVLRICDGQSIELWETEPFDRDLNRAVLVGIGFSVLLYQRGLWPLHVSAVRTGAGVWLFGGASGAGKSTLATWLHMRHGLEHLGDDAGVVTATESGFHFDCGSRAARLIPETAAVLIDDIDERQAIPTPSQDGKVKIRLNGPSHRAVPVLGLVMLGERAEGQAATVSELTGARALAAVREVIYRPFGGLDLRSAADTFAFCGAFSRQVPIYEFSRRKDFSAIESESSPLLSLILGEPARRMDPLRRHAQNAG